MTVSSLIANLLSLCMHSSERGAAAAWKTPSNCSCRSHPTITLSTSGQARQNPKAACNGDLRRRSCAWPSTYHRTMRFDPGRERIGNSSPNPCGHDTRSTHSCQLPLCVNLNQPLTSGQRPLLFGVRRDLMRGTSGECTLPTIRIWHTTPVTTPIHAPPHVPALQRRITTPMSGRTPVPGSALQRHPHCATTDNPGFDGSAQLGHRRVHSHPHCVAARLQLCSANLHLFRHHLAGSPHLRRILMISDCMVQLRHKLGIVRAGCDAHCGCCVRECAQQRSSAPITAPPPDYCRLQPLSIHAPSTARSPVPST